MKKKNIVRIALITIGLLLIPLIAMQFTNEVDWTPFDFVFMGAILFGAGLMFEFVASRGNTVVYRAAVGLAVLASLLLVWANAAVGIIGDENPANLLYGGVLAVGVIGLAAAGFEPRKLMRVLIAMAIAQALVPLIAILIWKPSDISWAPGVPYVFGLNAFFVMLYIVSALLFRHASTPSSRPNPAR